MIRSLLPVVGALLLCAHGSAALAADTTNSSVSSSESQLRQQIDAKRDQLSGVANVAPSTDKGSTTVLDEPQQTDDAPAQVQQP